MKKKFVFLLRAVVAIARDMFTGFLMGLCSALVMYKLNPSVHRAVGFLIPAGIIAGIFKGTAKFIFLSLSGAKTGYSNNYPRFKILAFWLLVSAGTLVWSFGLKFGMWVSEPVRLLDENILLGFANHRTLIGLVAVLSIIGLLSYIYEPPVEQGDISADQGQNAN